MRCWFKPLNIGTWKIEHGLMLCFGGHTQEILHYFTLSACLQYVHTSSEDGVFSFDWQMRWPCWSLQMAVWPLRCSSPCFILISLFRRPPRPAGSYLSQWRTLTEKGTWLLAWGRGGGGSRRILEAVFLLDFTQKCHKYLCNLLCFWQADSVFTFGTVGRSSYEPTAPQKQSYCASYLLLQPGGGPFALKVILCYISHVNVDNEETERELWRHLFQEVNNMLAYCTSRGRKKESVEEE